MKKCLHWTEARCCGGKRQSGFTLIELMIATTSSALLVAGMGSAMFIAARAADPDSTVMNTIDSAFVLEDTNSELRTALYFKERSSTSIKFVVGDQDGDSAPETIHYAWSGTAGDPLTRQFNSQSAVAVLDDVHQFNSTYNVQAMSDPGRLLFVVTNDTAMTSQELARKTQFKLWGYDVTPIDATASQAEYDEAVSLHQVAYISEDVLSSNLNTKLKEASIGIVNEERLLNDDFGLSSSSGTHTNDDIDITDNTHYITSLFSTGFLVITDNNEGLTNVSGTLASGLSKLAEKKSSSKGVLVVVDYGGALYGGGTAAGRRVTLPWGGNSFDFNELNSNGLTMMQRSIEWATGSYELTGIEIKLQVGSVPASLVESHTEILNRPRVTGP